MAFEIYGLLKRYHGPPGGIEAQRLISPVSNDISAPRRSSAKSWLVGLPDICRGSTRRLSSASCDETTCRTTEDFQNVSDDGLTPMCPKCGIDSVIGSASGF